MVLGTPKKTLVPKLGATALLAVIDVSPLQPPNALSPIEVTEFGMFTEVSPLQPPNALPPIEVTEFGITKDSRVTLL